MKTTGENVPLSPQRPPVPIVLSLLAEPCPAPAGRTHRGTLQGRPQGPAHPQPCPLPMPRVERRRKAPAGAQAGQEATGLPRASVSLQHPQRGHPQAGKRPRGQGRRRRRAVPSRAHKAPFIGAEFGFPLPAQHLAASCPARNAAVGAGAGGSDAWGSTGTFGWLHPSPQPSL